MVPADIMKGDAMLSKSTLLLGFLSLAGLVCPGRLFAQQQVTVSAPHTAVSDSFFEHTGTSWGAQGKNWFYQFGPRGNPNGAAPQFGGFRPSAGANFGGGFQGGGVGGGFLGNFSQGSSRSFTSVTPSVTMQNGGTGMIMDTSVSPFVMGYVPVVGGFPLVPPMIPPAPYIPPGPVSGHPGVLQALQNMPDKRLPSKPHVVGAHVPKRGNDEFSLVSPKPATSGTAAVDSASQRLGTSQRSSAGRPAMGVAEARRIRAAETMEHDAETQQLLERGRQAQDDGKLSLARTYYRMAVRRASPSLRQEALNHLTSLPVSGDLPH